MAQIGTVRLETQNSGVVDVPVFEPGDSASGIYEYVRVETASGPGFIPVTAPADATYPYLRVQSANDGIVAVTDTAGSDIPDSVVSRDADNNSTSQSAPWGVKFTSTVEWPEIGATISSNASDLTRAYIYRVSDDSLIAETDISGLVSGDSFTIEATIEPDTEYAYLCDAEGSSYTLGYNGNASFPNTSSDGQLTITSAAFLSSGSISDPNDPGNIVTIGNVGFS